MKGRDKLNEFQRKLFGTSSEKTKQNEQTGDEKPEETVTTVKSHKRTTDELSTGWPV